MELDNGNINESLREKYKFYFEKFKIEQDSDLESVYSMFVMLFEEIDIRRQEKIIEKANLVHSIICSDKTDISVLAFEVMHEVLRLWGIEDVSCILAENFYELINIDVNKMDRLKDIIDVACKRISASDETMTWEIENNLYGNVYLYFFSVYKYYDRHYTYAHDTLDVIKYEIEIAKKYCEFCEIIK